MKENEDLYMFMEGDTYRNKETTIEKMIAFEGRLYIVIT
jgi:hypothetical protein